MSRIRSFAIVPAAGRGVRMGHPKLLLPWRGATVIQHVLAAWTASRIWRVVVVVRPGDDDLVTVCRNMGVDVVVPATAPLQADVAAKAGIRVETLSRIESGKGNPTVATVKAILKALGEPING